MGHTCKRYLRNSPDTPAFLGGSFLFIVILAYASMYYVNHWIPRRPVPDAALPPAFMQGAFAGMTTRREQVDCHSGNPFAIPDKLPDFSPLTSFRRRPESSGLDKPFPPLRE